ncbi:hypothetical protein [Undibacterium sp. TS12]|uniref:hypothetical protein n=1 Tax=Undibacterium sp. TS12 TaxID=2908202 RepID=UPI001F4C99F6|nr:hypothetical protein [Undibacterium sp. TS12]MCH8620499.1 hypothetical protein [Undibacterium sp. TS12]
MRFAKYLFMFLSVGIFALPGPVLAKGGNNNNKKVTTLKEAEKISIEAVARYSHKKAELFSCRLVEENKKGWAFGCEEGDLDLPIGAVTIVFVQKENGRVEIEPGM